MSKEGQLIDDFDPKWAIRRNAENAHDWQYNKDAVFLYDMAVRFRNEIIDPIQRLERSQMPDPVIGFDDARNNKVLAYYTLGRNAQGLYDEIIFNTAHYEENDEKLVWKYGRWSQSETLLHEQTHLFMEHLSKIDGKKRPAHGKEFVEKCEQMGLHVLPVVGSHYQVAEENSPFGRLMKELGIDRPDDVPREKITKRDWFRPKPEKGRSTLHKWECPDCGLAVRIGIQDDPRLVHDVCSEKKGEKVFLVQHDGLKHTIYEGDDGEDKRKLIPPIIEEINDQLKIGLPQDAEAPKIEDIAQKFGIHKNTLYQWVKTDDEFFEALEILQDVQKDDIFKTGTIEDSQVYEAMLALLLSETIHRHDISNDS